MNEPPTSFFQLDAIPKVALGLIHVERPASRISEGTDGRMLGPALQSTAQQAERLAYAIASDVADPEDVKTILDEISSTHRGIDVLATVATKKCRDALDDLREFLSTGGASESCYQALLSANP